MNLRKSDPNEFFKPKQPNACLQTAEKYFKECLGREELNKLFPNKEITFVQIHYIKQQEYRKGDVISGLGGMTMMTLEFSDGSKQSIRWKDDPKINNTDKNSNLPAIVKP